MQLYCAHCKRAYRREDFRVTVLDRTLLWDGKRIAYLTHLRCHKRTVVLAGSIIGTKQSTAG